MRLPTPVQHPRQMLNLPSTGLLRARAGFRKEERRDSLRDIVAARRLIFARDVIAGETRVETIGTADGATGTVMLGGGGGGILAALPAPLGSLSELLRPPALPTPLIPLTPASCAKQGAVRTAASAKTKNADLPSMKHSRESATNESRGLAFRRPGSRNASSLPYLLACVSSRSTGERADASASTQA